MPNIFDKLESFEAWFDFSALKEKNGYEQILSEDRRRNLVASLHAILKPFLLRRVKADVETSLPRKREAYLENKVVETISGTATPNSARSSSLKRKAVDNTATPNKSAKSSRASTPAATASQTRSRKAKKNQGYEEVSDTQYFKQLEEESESPEEEEDDEDDEERERAKTLSLAKREIAQKKLQNPVMQLRQCCNSPHNFFYPFDLDDHTPVDETLVTESGKMLLLDRLLPELLKRGHKSDRQEQILSFNNTKSKTNIFLLSTRAGGQGINLTAADTVLLFDSDWNPQQDLQAQDRAHRIGQTRPVIVKGRFRSGKQDSSADFAELQKLLGRNDGERIELEEGKKLLSDEDLAILTDRSEEAFERAEKGLDVVGDMFKAVQTNKDGVGLLESLQK
ncbi:hypothetical protein MRB53_038983 [Persea americana]|nr:hypothetical protein MRB53_038983 [Persea americana]